MDLHAGRAGARTQMALASLQLIRSRRVGAVTYHRMLAEHGSAGAALAALPEIARTAGLTEYHPCPVEVARHEMSQARLAGATLLIHGQAGYPVALSDLPDAPPVLWAKGDLSLLTRPMLAPGCRPARRWARPRAPAARGGLMSVERSTTKATGSASRAAWRAFSSFNRTPSFGMGMRGTQASADEAH